MSNSQLNERRLTGWHLIGTDKWWPAWMGDPPQPGGWTWRPVYDSGYVR